MLSEIETMQTVTPDLAVLRQRIADATALPEEAAVKALLHEAQFDAPTLKKAQALAARLAQGVRDARIDAGGVDLLTQEFSLDSREGIALMCLAEAMLRIPDTQTRNQLIRDKIVDADWRAHIGKSPSLFVNATAWGLLVTGKLLKQPDDNALAEALTRVVRKGGEAVVRGGVAYAMRMLGKQFVTGQTIEEAIGVAKARESNGYRYSYDMLGEAALTDEDAQAYFESYRHAIEAIGRDAKGQGPIDGPGVSVKISGLHPRYELAQRERVLAEMYPRLLQLAQLARQYGIGFHLDQEESARFELTLDMLERLCKEPSLEGWNGIGISLQSYQKRGRAVAEWIIALARATQRRINIRLVKGAYWDTEIKLAQDAGANGYPVFTRKVHSDVSYIACAKALLAAPDAIFPQFATHNAFTVAAVHTLAGDQPYEFQCLHGMGETVYDQIVGAAKLGRACRIYAPVGPHATLLAYLVRRLLENGANSSFVNQIVDPAVSIDDIVQDPVAKASATGGKPHAGIVSPRALLPGRVNAKAMNFAAMPEFDRAIAEIRAHRIGVQSLMAKPVALASDATALVYSASDASEIIGSVASCRTENVSNALDAASNARATWAQTSRDARAAILDAVADHFEHECARLGALLVMEHGATLADAADEVRHAINLCRLYAYQLTSDERLAELEPLGVIVSITPVSSPLASFVGQTASVLAAGNVVVAKASSHAALIAHEAARAFLHCGVPDDVLQLVIHDGASFARAFASDRRVAAVSFAGSHEAARSLSVLLARQPHAPKFIGMQAGINAMIVDSSALPEQVISDAIHSAFKSAGQGASALRVLCLQDSTADRVLRMLKGMLTERVTGDPLHAATDIGPLATRRARDKAEIYIEQLKRRGFTVARGKLDASHGNGNFVAPAIVDMGDAASLDALDASISGPILHVVRYRTGQMEPLLRRLNALGAGVQGLHTRINEAAGKLLSITKANSVCINRAMHGAFAGMQPYGGVGAAGTGPMSGGPLTLLAMSLSSTMPSLLPSSSGPFAQQASVTSEKFFEFPVESIDGKLSDRQAALREAKAAQRARLDALFALSAASSNRQRDPALWSHVGEAVARYAPLSLPALTGEENTVEFLPRGQVLCVAESDADLLTQVMIASGLGNDIVMPESALADEIARKLGACVRVIGADDVPRALRGELSNVRPDVVLARGAQGSVADVRMIAAERMIPVIVADASGAYDWAALVRERVTTVNASAAGGNTQLMVMSEDMP